MVPYSLCSGCKAHLGFINALHSVRNQLFAHLSELKQKYPSAKVYFTGHSLGAALTTIAALETQRHGIEVEGLYTYGWYANLYT